MESLQLHTSDGHALVADVAEAEGAPQGAVVLCHPHPLYGGDRFHPIIAALFDALPRAGFDSIRFDFRAAHDGGVAERLDVAAALDHVAIGDRPVFVVGYSFGALVALSTPDARIAGLVAVAPPLAADASPPAAPVLVLTPRHDQFCAPDRAGAVVEAWPAAEFGVVESADHFLAGHSGAVADRVVAWLLTRLG